MGLFGLGKKKEEVRTKPACAWANEFQESTLEKKKMICCEIFKAIYVGKNTEIRLVMNSTYEQFLKESIVA